MDIQNGITLASRGAQYDVIIVGGGAAGLTAGLYAARRALKTLILAKDLGGQAATTPDIENYPGVDFTDGLDLMQKFRDQAEKHGAEFKTIEAEGIEKIDDGFLVKTPHESYQARCIILAFGLTPRDLGVPGEERLKGRGVSSCVTCDGPLFKNKRVLVAGGGTHALDAAEFMTKIASEVHLVHDRPKIHGAEALVKKVMGDSKITKHLGQKIMEIRGDELVSSVVLQGSDSHAAPLELRGAREIFVDGVFVEIGYIAKTDWLRGVVDIDNRGRIVTGRDGQTSCPGIFAAGDIIDADYKQVVISAGEGAKAALQAYKYLQHLDGRSIVPDWGFVKG